MAERLKLNQIREFEEAFDIFDTDNDGLIDIQDVIPLTRTLGYTPTMEELAQLVATTELEGLVNVLEFLDVMADLLDRNAKEREVLKSFRVYDVGGTGYMPIVHIHLVLHEYHGLLADEEIEMLLTGSELDDNGHLKYDKLVRALIRKI